MIEGTKIQILDKEYIVPSLTFKQVKSLQNDINEIGSVKDAILTEEKIDKMVTIIQAAFSRNYHEVTKEYLEEIIDLRNIREIFHAVLGVSGFVEKKREV